MEKRIKIHNTVGIITAALIAILGISLAILSIAIYTTGGARPYSRESIGDGLKYVIIQAILAIASVIAGAVIKFAYPIPSDKLKPLRDQYMTLDTLTEKVAAKDARLLSADDKVNREKAIRGRIKLILTVALILLGTVAILVATLTDYDSVKINQSVIKVTAVVLSLSLVGGALGYVASILSEASVKREIDELRSLLIIADGDPKVTEDNSGKRAALCKNVARIAILAVAVAFIALGIFNGGMGEVLGKAVRICTECIGLG